MCIIYNNQVKDFKNIKTYLKNNTSMRKNRNTEKAKPDMYM